MRHAVPDTHPPEHPERDVLADLAADVLPGDQAATVQAHVLGCERCAQLLADAEGIRGLLLADPPGPMPAQVLARIETAIAAAGPGGAARPAADAPVRPRPVRPAGRPSSGRGSRGPQRTRRQVREEDRDGRPGRRGSLLLAAAAIALVVAGGGLALRELTWVGAQDGGSTAESAAGGDAGVAEDSGGGSAAEAPAAAAAGVVVSTGTDYSEGKLAAQVTSLVDRVSARRASGDLQALQRDAKGGNQALRSPAALQACLAAIESRGEQPLAVDLARYERQEAAIVVLPGRDGGYEVWAVARSCGPDGDGTLKFASVRR